MKLYYQLIFNIFVFFLWLFGYQAIQKVGILG
jgi:hypothetical protein